MYTNKLELSYSDALHNYDIFPKVVPAGRVSEITIKPLGTAFEPLNYRLSIHPWDEGQPMQFPDYRNDFAFDATPAADGCIRFSFEFFGEQEHYIRLMYGAFKLQLSVYSVAEDLVGRYPFKGDLHLHSTASDGRQAPAVVAANYRKTGYDFLAITDHHRYAPSMEAMQAYQDVPIELCLVPGEEVHVPNDDEEEHHTRQHLCNAHYINFGGLHSVNELWADGREEAHWAEVDAYMQTIDIPDCFTGMERYYYASCHWVTAQIRKAGGLSIFCHPYWISNVLQIPPRLVDKFMEHQPFDAFEVLGGENNFEQNGYQIVQYYEDMARGRRYPIVGSTDSHNSVNSRNSHVCSTLVFSPENERRALIDSILGRYTCAIDTIDPMPRFVGEWRFVRYACFLDKNFFPLHDELCFEEGRAMKDYACGVPGAKETLEFISGRMKAQREKYFGW